jgi:peptidoglycan hydrolase-like protein with peptidoglycan-binding domain
MTAESVGAHRAPKRLTAARLAGVDELEETFSDLTDTLDIWDGGGEQPPSRGRHVELLQESLLEMGYPLPGYGVDGIYGAETTAAVLQFQIDAGHPLPPGHEWEHVLGIGGPNTLAHFDMFTPGGTVGYATPETTGAAAESVRFAESPDNLLAGFDDSVSPPSLVVGTSTRRRVRVEVEPADADVEFAADDPSVATVGLTHEGIVVGGERAGTTVVRGTSQGTVLGELRVSVKDGREESVNFFFVSTTNPSEGTTRDHEKAMLLTLRLNRVLRRQANVRFTRGRVADVVLQHPAGSGVGPDDLHELARSAVAGGFNVFLVRAIAPGLEPVHLSAGDDAPAFMVLPDDDCPDGMDVMHGMAHYLAQSLADGRSGVTAPCGMDTDRRRVPHEVADMVNASGRG